MFRKILESSVGRLTLASVGAFMVLALIMWGIIAFGSRPYKPFIDTETANASKDISPECVQRHESAKKEAQPYVDQQNTINAEENSISATYAVQLDPGYYQELPNLPPSVRSHLHDLGMQYIQLGDKIDAINKKWECN